MQNIVWIVTFPQKMELVVLLISGILRSFPPDQTQPLG